MSRRYCDVCKEAHNNRESGLCDKHEAEQEERNRQAHNVEADAYTRFLEMSEQSRLESIYDFLRSLGYEP